MASSHVGIAATSSPFAHSHRDPCFPTNLNLPHVDFTDLWVHQPQWQSPDADRGRNGIRKPDKWAKAREIVLNVDHGSAGGSAEASNLGGVSSLVKKWRGFESNRSNTGPPTPTPTPTTGTMYRMDSSSTCPSTPAPTPALSHSLSVDSFLGDWEPDRAAAVTGQRKAIEIERLKVSDIVKKLTINDVSSDSSPQRCTPPVVNTPRIRGPQALKDLLTRIERDRKKELGGIAARKPVSEFPHRGRIQAFLRYRLLRRGIQGKDDCHSNMQTAIQRVKPCVQVAVIATQFDEATGRLGKQTDRTHDSKGSVTSKQQDDVGQSSEKVKEATPSVRLCHSYENLGHAENPFSALIGKDPKWENNNHEQLSKSAGNDGPFHTTAIDFTEKNELHHTIETTSVHSKEEDGNSHHQVTVNNFEDEPTQDFLGTTGMFWVIDSASNPEEWEEEQEESNREWIYQVSRPRSDWEDLRQARYQEMHDHFLDNEDIQVLLGRRSVSTFLSSGLREKLEQVLLSRAQGNVQRILKNNLTREKEKREISWSEEVGGMDEQDKEDDYNDINSDEYETYESSVGQQYNNESDEYTDQIMTPSWPQNQSSDYSYPPQILSPSAQLSPSNFYSPNRHQIPSPSAQLSPSNFYSPNRHQIPSPSAQLSPSNFYSPNRHQIPSPSAQQSPSNFYSPNRHQISSPSTQPSQSNFYSPNSIRRANSSDSPHPSAIDMELIYDLRGHMEQLRQEMSELRKTIKCCVDMQINLQRTIKKEGSTALHGGCSETKNGQRNAVKKATSNSGSNGGMCCVCAKTPVDSLLYKCGHMCTCFNCAHKLQWNSGNCPICTAPILDVVRAYANHS